MFLSRISRSEKASRYCKQQLECLLLSSSYRARCVMSSMCFRSKTEDCNLLMSPAPFTLDYATKYFVCFSSLSTRRRKLPTQNTSYRDYIGHGIQYNFQYLFKFFNKILGRLEFLVVFGPFWPLEVSIGTKLYNQIVQFNRTYSSIYILVPIETSSGQNGPKQIKNSNRLAALSVQDPNIGVPWCSHP